MRTLEPLPVRVPSWFHILLQGRVFRSKIYQVSHLRTAIPIASLTSIPSAEFDQNLQAMVPIPILLVRFVVSAR